MEKVKLPREVAEAIETLRLPSHDYSNYDITGMMHDLTDISPQINTIKKYVRNDPRNADEFLKALVNGYEVEETPEKMVSDLFYSDEHIEFKKGVLETIRALGIKVKGVNA